MWHHFLGDVTKHLLTPDMEPTTDQHKESTEAQFGGPMSLMGLLLGAGVTRGHLLHQEPTPAWGTAHES